MQLPKVQGVYKFNYKLSTLNWFKVGGLAKVLFKPKNKEDLIKFFEESSVTLPIVVLGAGSNVIIRDNGVNGVVIKLGNKFSEISMTKEGHLSVGAACLNYNLAKFCLINSIAGFEFLSGIPGSIGGGVAMNAGAYNWQFQDIVLNIEAINFKGRVFYFSNKDIGFSYRANNLASDLVITNVVFKCQKGDYFLIRQKMLEIKEHRERTQPINEKTAGSVFKNPKGQKAWKLIDHAGLRGYRIGGAMVSDIHCNFIINSSNATATDIEKLGEYIKAKVKYNSGIDLQWEIRRIG